MFTRALIGNSLVLQHNFIMIVVGNEEGVLWIDKLHCFSEEGTSTHLFSFMREIHHLITFSTCAKDISHTN